MQTLLSRVFPTFGATKSISKIFFPKKLFDQKSYFFTFLTTTTYGGSKNRFATHSTKESIYFFPALRPEIRPRVCFSEEIFLQKRFFIPFGTLFLAPLPAARRNNLYFYPTDAFFTGSPVKHTFGAVKTKKLSELSESFFDSL